MSDTIEIPLFPLNTVLYPGGRLPLRIFEVRYVDMVKRCLSRESEFGVCQILEGRETGQPALSAQIGCSARILEWEVPGPGLFSLVTRGENRFRVLSQRVQADGLIIGEVQWMPTLEPQPLADEHKALGQMVGEIVNKIGSGHFCEPIDTQDAIWVAYRLAEVLPLTIEQKLNLLEETDARTMLNRLSAVIERMREDDEE